MKPVTVRVTIEVEVDPLEFKETYDSDKKAVAEHIASCIIGNDFETCVVLYHGEEI